MKVHVRVDGNIGDHVERALRTTGRAFEPDATGFMISLTEPGALAAGAVELVVTSDPIRRELTCFPGAAGVLYYGGDEADLASRLRSVFHFAAAAADASPHRQLLEECPVPIFVKSVDGKVLYANAASREAPDGHVSVRGQVAPPAPSSEVRVVEQVEEWRRSADADADTGDAFVTPRERGFRKTTSALRDLDDGTQVVMDVVADISMNHAVQEELSQELTLMRGLLDALPSLVLVTDEDDSIVLLNPSLSRLLGQEPEKLLAVRVDDAMTPEALLAWRSACAEARATGREVRYESESKMADGTIVAHNGTTRATVGPGGQAWILTVAVDVSELRRAQREAENSTSAAVEASRIKSQFLANMSHEIRTPMNGVLGMLELALGTSLTPEQREYLEAAHMSADSLLTIINDILDISKIEAGKLTLETIPFSLTDVVEGLTTLETRAHEKGLETSIEVDKHVPDSLAGDPVRFRQILVNLFGNAIKFTKDGSIRVRMFMEPGEADLIHVEVKDSGIGIPADQQAHLFAAFQQADGTTTRRFGGTGLGLSICRELTALMGGKIWVESVPGSGSSFHFTARLPKSDTPVTQSSHASRRKLASGEHPVTPPPSRKLTVLLAEDNPVGAKLAKKLLEILGCEPIHAWDGQQAFDAATSRAFDLVFMDMQMPVMDGLEATAKIRAWEKFNGKGRMPIYALTANAMKGDAETCMAAGMDGHLAKPLEKDLLRQLINRIGSMTEEERAKPPKPARPAAVDLKMALERCGDDTELLAEVAVAYEESVAVNGVALRAAMAANDPSAVHKAAHSLKGVFVYVCAERAAELAQAICLAGRQGNLDGVPGLIDALLEECQEVSRELSHLNPAPAAAPAA
jgi:PAS domain S-box-containing protein